MPWAGDDRPLKDAPAERAAALKTCIVDSVKVAPDIGQRDGLTIDLDFLDGTSRHIGSVGCLGEGHSDKSPIRTGKANSVGPATSRTKPGVIVGNRAATG